MEDKGSDCFKKGLVKSGLCFFGGQVRQALKICPLDLSILFVYVNYIFIISNVSGN